MRNAAAAIALCVGIGVLPNPSRAQQATGRTRVIEAYGARVGVRNERPDAPGSSQDVRAVKRLPTRIDSRVAARLERYADPNRGLWAYTVTPDDRSRQPVIDVAPPVERSRSPVDTESDGSGGNP